MTFFGITLFADIDLPEFPFPDLGRLGDEEDTRPNELGPGRRPPATRTGGARRERLGERRVH